MVVVSAEAKAAITKIDFPYELEAGAWITGEVRVKNVGTAKGSIKLRLTRMWDDMFYEVSGVLEVGQELVMRIPEGAVRMPNQDAVIKVEAFHLGAEGWVLDDVKWH